MRVKCELNAGRMRDISKYPTQSYRIRGDDNPDFSGAIDLDFHFQIRHLGRAQTGLRKAVSAPTD